MTMAHSLESRAPLLDAPLADFAMCAASRYEGHLLSPPKRLFRELARRIYGPKVADGKKQGFSIPVHTWLRSERNGERGRALVGDLLARGSLAAVPILDAESVVRVRDRFLAGEQLGFEIWGLLVLVQWYRTRVAAAPTLALETTPSQRTEKPSDRAATLRRFEL
jgi:asparagine synthase (glutamine-hydrolysing)